MPLSLLWRPHRVAAGLIAGLLLAASLATTPARADVPTATPAALVLQPGSPGTGGLPSILAGDSAARTPDRLEPDDTFEQARPIDFGVVYQNLNFVPAASQPGDPDFYALRVKPGTCYTVVTADLGPALDTTLLLWRAAPLHQDRRLLAQNDDTVPHSPNLGSTVHWCQPPAAPDAEWLVLEVHNYGLVPATGPLGNTYSLLASIDPPPTPTPTRTPRPPTPVPAPPAPNTVGSAGYAAPPVPALPTATRPAPPSATPPPAPTATVVRPPAAATPVPTAPTVRPTVAPPAGPSATPPPPIVSADVIVYSADTDTLPPPPDAGVAGYPVSLIVLRTNAPLPGSTVRTDAHGHARLQWTWQEPVLLALPEGRWSTALRTPADLTAQPGPLYARLPAYPLPRRWP